MSLSTVILDFARGTEPPERMEGEKTDDYQGRQILWLRRELKAHRGLIWLLVAIQTANWLGIRPPGM